MRGGTALVSPLGSPGGAKLEVLMTARRRYRRRAGTRVAAVQLDLETPGFSYRKWGANQRCKAGDWLVKNGEETYTVDRQAFARTYCQVGLGVYEKVAPVWAEPAVTPGAIETLEGPTHYDRGDYLVYENADGRQGWAIDATRFKELYEPDDAAD